jgi:hypothetical protein
MSLMTLHCPECHDDRLFEPPHDRGACPDRTDSPLGCCPELACTGCGTAMIVGFAVPTAGPWAAGGRPQCPERAA